MSIRVRVALPFLLLTVIVSVIGVYVVTRLVTGSLEERLTNQLLEAGRVVSDNFVRLEERQVNEALQITYTEGLAEAVASEDRETIRDIVEPYFALGVVENIIIVSPQRNEILHLLRTPSGETLAVEKNTGASNSPIVVPFFKSKDPNEQPRRALGVNYVNEQPYYYSSLPISAGGKFSGVIIVGTSIETILPTFKQNALADIIIYDPEGKVLGTTFGSANSEVWTTIGITPETYSNIVTKAEEGVVTGGTFEIAGRLYSIGRAPLQVGNDRIAVFAVALPADFVVQFGANNRLVYVIIFTTLLLAVAVIGFFVGRTIIVPLYSLVNTSQAIADGDLDRRTGIQSGDEIGKLANSFDLMTSSLKERTIELEKTNDTLRKIDKTKSNFIQISAHELRTPLTIIMGYSQMLTQDLKDDPDKLYIAQGILDGAERMTDVVDSMLDVSRIDNNALVLRKFNTQLAPVIAGVRKEFEPALEERNIQFEEDGVSNLPEIKADPDMMKKVFHHLIMNAIKYTPDGGSVGVIGRYVNGSEPPHLEVTIQDTGIGIDPEMHELIFDKFHQTGEVLLHSTGKTKFKGGGPGLGLAIARGIVKAHGGNIRVESPGHDEETMPGSKFIVSLPLEVAKDNEK
ncbi:MAG: HAMP domain-containing protein [Anaerolineales bacterium]|nr:HAMP domain-containing protein [Anaerolineales bacterium]